MKPEFFLVIFCFLFSKIMVGQTSLFRFTFENTEAVTIENAVGTPTFGSSGVNASNYFAGSNNDCSGSTGSARSHAGWDTGDHYVFAVNTTGFSGLSFQICMRCSNVQVGDFLIRASINGGSTWETINSTFTPTTTFTFYGGTLSNDFDDQESVLIQIYKPTTAGDNANNIRVDNAILTGDAILPVSLIDFIGKNGSNDILLSWSTATEKNNDYMAIERSVDGNNFSEIGRVKGAGSSLERIDYSFIDRFPYAGTNYYRLRQVDYDGTSTYHKVIAVEYTGVSENSLRFIPTAEEVQVQFRVPGAGGNMVLVDATGRVLRTQKFDPEVPSVHINTGGLPRGFYVVQVRRADGKQEAWPLVK